MLESSSAGRATENQFIRRYVYNLSFTTHLNMNMYLKLFITYEPTYLWANTPFSLKRVWIPAGVAGGGVAVRIPLLVSLRSHFVYSWFPTLAGGGCARMCSPWGMGLVSHGKPFLRSALRGHLITWVWFWVTKTWECAGRRYGRRDVCVELWLRWWGSWWCCEWADS